MAINPCKLLLRYVALTQSQGVPGGPLLLHLQAPFRALCANTVGSIPKNLIKTHGIDTGVWTAHSSRGAGVQLYKSWGLLSEEVEELGRGGKFQAFSRHYLRVGTAKKAGQSLMSALAQKVSPGQRAEDDGSWTPGRKPDAERERPG